MYAGEIIEYGSVEDLFTGEAHHPYTVGLFGSIPSLESEEDRLHPIDGMMPGSYRSAQGLRVLAEMPEVYGKMRRSASGAIRIRQS